MVPSKREIDAMFWEEIRAARSATAERKLLAGAQLYDRVRRLMSDGVRNQYPEANDDEVREIVRARFALARRLETVG